MSSVFLTAVEEELLVDLMAEYGEAVVYNGDGSSPRPITAIIARSQSRMPVLFNTAELEVDEANVVVYQSDIPKIVPKFDEIQVSKTEKLIVEGAPVKVGAVAYRLQCRWVDIDSFGKQENRLDHGAS